MPTWTDTIYKFWVWLKLNMIFKFIDVLALRESHVIRKTQFIKKVLKNIIFYRLTYKKSYKNTIYFILDCVKNFVMDFKVW